MEAVEETKFKCGISTCQKNACYSDDLFKKGYKVFEYPQAGFRVSISTNQILLLVQASMKVHLKTHQYGKTASKKINLSSISCCVLCKGENAYLVYKNETTQFQHQEKPFECRNCPRGYFLRKVFIPMLDSNFLF